MVSVMTEEFDIAQEAADAIRFGYTIPASVREELARWLEKDRTNSHAQRVAHLMNIHAVPMGITKADAA